MQKEIGGYFNLELNKKGHFPHDDGVLLNTGRNAIQYILQALNDVKMVYVPFFTCNSVIEPLITLGLQYQFYHIDNNLHISEDIQLQEQEYLIYTNYYGIMDTYAKKLAEYYGDKLIIDNAQALFAEHIPNINTAYSPRKFVGIPDGGIAYCNKTINIKEQDQSYNRCSHLLKRYDLGARDGYDDFHTNSKKLHNLPIKRTSELTLALMRSIDYDYVVYKRKSNFQCLHNKLKNSNKLHIPDFNSFNCPLVYPYLCKDSELKINLIDNQVYVATYWPNVFDWCKPLDLEYMLAKNIIAIPIDQRYNNEEMDYIIKKIQEYEQ